MVVSLSPSKKSATADIVVSPLGSRPVFSQLKASYPLKLIAPKALQKQSLCVYLLSYGYLRLLTPSSGGLVCGDTNRFNITTNAPGSNLTILTQGSSKVYKATTTTSGCRQDFSFRVCKDSTILYLPCPTVCFSNARFEQTLNFHIAGSIVCLDWFTCGRIAMDEEWKFQYFSTTIRLFNARDELILQDSQRLTQDGDVIIGASVCGYKCFATLLLYGPSVRKTIDAMREEYSQYTIGKGGCKTTSFIWSMEETRDGNGALVKVASVDPESVKGFLQGRLGSIDQICGSDVWERVFVQ